MLGSVGAFRRAQQVRAVEGVAFLNKPRDESLLRDALDEALASDVGPLVPTVSRDKASSGNKWNVPVGLTVAKTTNIGKLPNKFQFGIEKSVVRQDDFGQDWQVKLNIIPVIPSLFKNPTFLTRRVKIPVPEGGDVGKEVA
jgi:hypothetical protein